jgi:hypothetical protein
MIAKTMQTMRLSVTIRVPIEYKQRQVRDLLRRVLGNEYGFTKIGVNSRVETTED